MDRALYVPRSWTCDPDRCRAAGLGEDTVFATQSELARVMIERFLDAGHHALPPLPPACPPCRPRPPPLSADRADLALSEGVHHLLAASDRPARRYPTNQTTSSDEARGGAGPHDLRVPWEPWRSRSDTRRPAREHAEQTGRTGSPRRQSRSLTNRGQTRSTQRLRLPEPRKPTPSLILRNHPPEPTGRTPPLNSKTPIGGPLSGVKEWGFTCIE
ncbi:hypothetical protein [Streptomyces hirsutus]|uniref:hypothetical protein n=1 Tax=Streptomyces hirsutus TaxID=35620 RepID=UPI003B97B370